VSQVGSGILIGIFVLAIADLIYAKYQLSKTRGRLRVVSNEENDAVLRQKVVDMPDDDLDSKLSKDLTGDDTTKPSA
jgi:hypothetical protein